MSGNIKSFFTSLLKLSSASNDATPMSAPFDTKDSINPILSTEHILKKSIENSVLNTRHNHNDINTPPLKGEVNSMSSTLPLRYQSFPGSNKWVCGGICMFGSGYSQVHVTTALILTVWMIFITFIIPIVDAHPMEVYIYMISIFLLILNLISLLLTACTDPGNEFHKYIYLRLYYC